jgi:hypothetical protein
MILKLCVIEPVVVKTVSYFKLSAVIVTRASGAVMNDSFLQVARKNMKDKMNRVSTDFIQT